MRSRPSVRFAAVAAALALVATACGNGDDGDTAADIEVPDGPTIDVASFNFPESEILAEIYAQAMEDAGYPIDRSLNLGSRELIYPDLIDGGIGFVPEYVGSALVVWFEQDPPEDVDSGVSALSDAFEADGVSVLEPAPAENPQAFVVTAGFASEQGLSTLGDLADVGAITLAGPPECEQRDTCYRGLVDTYGLSEVGFESVQEAAARLAALESGDVEMILLFATDAPLAGDELVVLEDDQGMLPPENITPVVRTEILDAYGDDLRDLLDRVSAALSTEALRQMNAEASEGRSAAEIASDWLADNL
jgi:osmoprotectant transport system substrate-binding protein